MRVPRSVAWLLCAVVAATAACQSRSPVDRTAAPVVADEVVQPEAAAALAPLWPDGRGGTVVAVAGRFRLRIFDTPGGPRGPLLWKTNPWGQTIRYEVLAARRTADGGSWYRVRLPVRPSGSTGWVRGSDVATARVHDRIVVDLSDHELRHFRRGRLLSRLTVAAGAPSTPTPPGRYFVWAQVRYDDPTGPYGAYALGLSGFSRVLTNWPGGGRLAIHGTADPSDRGRDVSHGCVRVYNPELLAELRGVPLGTPVLIRP